MHNTNQNGIAIEKGRQKRIAAYGSNDNYDNDSAIDFNLRNIT